MLQRSLKGNLTLNSLDMQIFLGDLFYKCKTLQEVQWLEGELQTMVECMAEEVIDEEQLA